jgi:hypothetical protein
MPMGRRARRVTILSTRAQALIFFVKDNLLRCQSFGIKLAEDMDMLSLVGLLQKEKLEEFVVFLQGQAV